MDLAASAPLKARLRSQATELVARATDGVADEALVEALLEVCQLLEDGHQGTAPLVAIEREVHLDSNVYHLSVRRLRTSVPAGKFQILISCDLASGLVS